MYIFGPVASRRLGISLGINLIGKRKVCDLNCIYCELGRTFSLSYKRKIYVKTKDVIKELKNFLKKNKNIDFITISGNGEPTLALNLGKIINEIKKITDKKIAVITNGTLLFDKKVREDLKKADLVLPSLDAGTEKTFLKINRPEKNLNFNKIVKGLITFSRDYKGKIWLEIMIVKDVNDNLKELKKIKEIINKMPNVEKIQLNTVVRLGTEKYALPVDERKLLKIKKFFGKKAEIIGNYKGKKLNSSLNLENQIINILKLRPVTLDELERLLDRKKIEIVKKLKELEKNQIIQKKKFNNQIFYKTK